MKNKNSLFYIVCGILIAFAITFFLNLWYNFIPGSYTDKYVIILFFTIIGLALLPFANKLKIANFIEIDRLKEKIDEVQLNQYLGEIIKTPKGDLLYYDSDGTHSIPDIETANFLRSSKGEISVSQAILNQMMSSYPFNSVVNSEKINWCGKHIFVILNGKKYWVGPSDIADIGIPNGDTSKLRFVDDAQIKLIPTGK
jgi:hypothetical protein